MRKTVKAWAMLAALAGLTACDRSASRELRQERESSAYHSAMTDYKAGRIDQALAGFRKACKEDPGNGSARFQLACLLQDKVRDYLGAYCAYHMYLETNPGSDKSKLAKDRAAICEIEVAKKLAERHGLTSNTMASMETDKLRAQLKDLEMRNSKLTEIGRAHV